MEQQAIRDLVKVWYQRARRERDPISKFVFLWFCFNAWLAFESGRDTDRQMINWLRAPASRSRLRAAYDSVRGGYFDGRVRLLANMCPIESRRSRSEVVIASIDDFPNVVEAIYRVRCNLFHGSKRPNDPRDLKLVMVSSNILEKWIGNLITGFRVSR